MATYESSELDLEEAMDRARSNEYVQSLIKSYSEAEEILDEQVQRSLKRFNEEDPGLDIAIARLDRDADSISPEEYDERVDQIAEKIGERYAEPVGERFKERMDDESYDLWTSVAFTRTLEKSHLGGWGWPSESHWGGPLSTYLYHEFKEVN